MWHQSQKLVSNRAVKNYWYLGWIIFSLVMSRANDSFDYCCFSSASDAFAYPMQCSQAVINDSSWVRACNCDEHSQVNLQTIKEKDPEGGKGTDWHLSLTVYIGPNQTVQNLLPFNQSILRVQIYLFIRINIYSKIWPLQKLANFSDLIRPRMTTHIGMLFFFCSKIKSASSIVLYRNKECRNACNINKDGGSSLFYTREYASKNTPDHYVFKHMPIFKQVFEYHCPSLNFNGTLASVQG